MIKKKFKPLCFWFYLQGGTLIMDGDETVFKHMDSGILKYANIDTVMEVASAQASMSAALPQEASPAQDMDAVVPQEATRTTGSAY